MSQSAPREILKSILQGSVPERPLVVPIVFSLGAKVENLPLRAYLENPTKITNALRQICAQLRTDGVTCYFDPLLEMEALGGMRVWDSTNQMSRLEWPNGTHKGELPARVKRAEEAAKSLRVMTAVEVIRRLKATMRDEPLLMAAVSAPFTLAARLTGLDSADIVRGNAPFEAALEVAAATTTKIAAAWAEAGANLIFIREDWLPALDTDKYQIWTSLVRPVFNTIRFYEALPVLQLAEQAATAHSIEAIIQEPSGAVLCCGSSEFLQSTAIDSGNVMLGVFLRVERWQAGGAWDTRLPDPGGTKPVLLTTDRDVPVATDLKRLMASFDSVSKGF